LSTDTPLIAVWEYIKGQTKGSEYPAGETAIKVVDNLGAVARQIVLPQFGEILCTIFHLHHYKHKLPRILL